MGASDVRNYISILDMGYIWRLGTPTSEDREKQDGTVFTWRDYSKTLFDLIIRRHQNSSTIILVNDPYDLPVTIKASEHERRADGIQFAGGSKNVFIKPLNKFPSSQEFKVFFQNKGNKIRLQEFLREEFRIFSSTLSIDFIYSVQKACEDLQTKESLSHFQCHHFEADSIIFFICSQLRMLNRTETIIIDAEDTGVVTLAANVSHELPGIMGIYHKKNIFDCKKLCTSEIADIIVQFHAITGADCVSGFFGHGKKSVYKSMIPNKTDTLILRVVDELPASPEIIQCMTDFTIKTVYNDKLSKSLADSRGLKWKILKKKSTQR